MSSRTNRSEVKRAKDRAAYDEASINAILDDGKLCHVGISFDGQPFVIPMAYARQGNTLILHGAPKSRLMKALVSEAQVCITVTHLDGLVLARSTFHHSMNYRSVVLFGKATLINDEDEKLEALNWLTESLTPGRSTVARAPSEGELKGTDAVRFTIEEASAKTRSGPPKDAPGDMDLKVWAGVIPITQTFGEPIPDPDLRPGIEYS